jgi:light-regulated signal transduction histidine kinase (bacteriophytochrome)
LYGFFGLFPYIPRNSREIYLLFPLLIWTALRFGPRGAATAVFGVSTLILLSMAVGKFGDPSRPETTLPLQVFLGVMSSTILLFAASDAERRRDFAALCDLKADLEAQVRRRTAALAASNRDLEEFAFRVSHDLRAPLRAVSGFAAVLVQQHAEELSPEARSLLGRVIRQAERMTRLVEVLLGYARIGRTEPRLVDVDLGELVRGILDEMAVPHAHVAVGDLGRAHADPLLLRQVFSNLLENAFKYSRAREPPQVVVDREVVGAETAWFVRDNGVGFDMGAADKLFHVFSRLHGAEFEGTGVGLAIVQRIIELHGGRVWAHSVPGEGATFWFTLGA